METMSEMIRIEPRNFSGENINSVDARELHAALEVKTKFADWIKDRIEVCGFVDGVDYVSFLNIQKREIGATTSKEYALTTDAAKHVSMLEKNAQGFRVRRFFIEIEKDHRAIASVPTTFAEALELAARLERERLQLLALNAAQTEELAIAKPKASYATSILISESEKSFTDVAKALGMTAQGLYKFCRTRGLIYAIQQIDDWKDAAGKVHSKKWNKWYPSAAWQSKGIFHISTSAYSTKAGAKSKDVLRVTEAGKMFLARLQSQPTATATEVYKALWGELPKAGATTLPQYEQTTLLLQQPRQPRQLEPMNLPSLP